MKKLILILLLIFAPSAYATNAVYISNTGAGTGASCVDSKPASYFNTAANWSGSPSGILIGPDTTVHLCGIISTTLTAQGSGSSGHPIIILFEAGAKLSQALCPSTGCLNIDGKTDITIDGGGTGSVGPGTFVANGLVENTAAGSALTNKNPTTYGISAGGVNRVTIQNLLCQNIYVMVQNSSTPISDAQQARCFSIAGSNIEVKNSVLHDVGWAIVNFYANGNQHALFHDLEIYNFGHAFAVATQNASAAANDIQVYNIKAHDTANWQVAGCGGMHDDFLHVFSTGGATLGNSIDNLLVHDNYIYGNWGTCASAHIFVEGGTDRANMVHGYFWNNVSIIPPGAVAISWHSIFSATTSVLYVNNSVIGPGTSPITKCVNIGSVNSPTIKNNVTTGCSAQVDYGSLTGTKTIDFNGYDGSCSINFNNCYVFNGAFTGSLTNFRSALAGAGVVGAELNGLQAVSPTLSPTGQPLSGSPYINKADNLSTTATGQLAGLQNDTTLGGSRTPTARPGGSTAWTMGAFNANGATAPILSFGPSAVSFGNVNVGSTGSVTLTISNVGTASETYSAISLTPSVFTNGNTGLSGQCTASGSIAVSGSCTVLVKFSPAAVTSYSGTLTVTGTVTSSVALSGTGTNAISIPNPPTGLTATASGNSAVLNWTASTGTPANYIVRRGTVSGGPYTTIATLGLVTTYTDSGLANGTYYYVVAASNSAGTSANSAQATAIILTAPVANLNPSTLNFGSVVQGVTSPIQTVTLTNMGTATLSSISFTNPSNLDYVISSNSCGSSLGINASCTFTVTFTPSTTTTENSALVVSSNDPNGPDTVTLTGTGTAPVTISPTSLNFGNFNPHKTSPSQTLTFTNNSGATVTFTSVALTTGTQYAISSNSCTGTLVNGASCTTSITFTPTSTGTKTDTLTYTDSAGVQTVAITGQANKKGILRVGAAIRYKVPSGFEIQHTIWHGRTKPSIWQA